MIRCQSNYHKSQITSFCAEIDCLEFFCNYCVGSHSEYHRSQNTQSKIQSVDETKSTLYRKLQNTINQIQQMIFGLSIDNLLIIQEESFKQFQKLQEAKQILIQWVDDYINDFSSKINQQIEVTHQKLNVCKQIRYDAEQQLKLLQNLQIEVTQKPLLELKEPFSTVQRLDLINLLNKLESKCQAIANLEVMQPINLKINSHDFYQISSFLSKLVYLQSTEGNQQKNQKLTLRSQQLSGTIKEGNNGNSNFNTNPQFYQQVDIHQSFLIKIDNYLEKKLQFLSCFIDETSLLRIFNLDSKKWQDLDVQFQIPKNHCSIVLPDGKIYISGGTFNSSNYASIAIYNNNIIQKKRDLIQARSSHSMIFFFDSIYIIGGILSNGLQTKTVEKYHISTNQIYQCSNCHFEAVKPTLCAFQNNYIYKIGAQVIQGQNQLTIERYQPSKDSWSIIQMKQNYYLNNLLKYSACIQINDDSIFVFGGQNQFDQYVNDTYLIQIKKNDEHSIFQKTDKKLPVADELYNRQAIIYNKHLYIIQNNTQKGQLNNYSKRVLFYNSQNWQEIN